MYVLVSDINVRVSILLIKWKTVSFQQLRNFPIPQTNSTHYLKPLSV